MLECAVIGVPDEQWGESVKRLRGAQTGPDGDRGGHHRRRPPAPPPIKNHVRWSSSPGCPRRPPANCSSGSCAHRTGRTGTSHEDTRRIHQRDRGLSSRANASRAGRGPGTPGRGRGRRYGIQSVTVAGDLPAPEMALRASRQAMQRAGQDPAELSLLLYVDTGTRDPTAGVPSTTSRSTLAPDRRPRRKSGRPAWACSAPANWPRPT
ncbi:hypothetical protein ACN28S_25175 [Cystobacter fuscus]